jgi:FkbM family methyltransferase
MPSFRPNTWDANIWNSIVESNEYSIIDNWPHNVIDIGGHIGSFSYFITAKKGAKKVIVLEPDPNNFHLLQQNLKPQIDNGVVIAFNAGIGSPNSTLSLVAPIADNTGGISYTESDSGTIRTFTLDNLIDLLVDDSPILLKLDCEGCEYTALEQCTKLSRINAIVGEFHVRGDKNHESLKNILVSHNFLFSSHFTGSNYIGLFGAHQEK